MEFQSVFSELFGGGRADLVMTNPEDLLNTGIDIVAQPPEETAKLRFTFRWRACFNGNCAIIWYFKSAPSPILCIR